MLTQANILVEYLKGLTLLCVEDEITIQEIYKEIFSDFFKEVLCADNGEEGLALLENSKVDVIITDYMMPRLDGLKMIERIRETDRAIPIILVTAIDDTDVMKRAINLGVTHFLNKPIALNEMMNVIESAAKTLFADTMITKEKEEKITLLEEKDAYASYQEELAFKKELNIIRNDFYYRLADENIGDGTYLIDSFYKPIDILSGDSYSIRRINKDIDFYLLVDAMGKGVSASMTTMMMTSFINHHIDNILAEGTVFELDALIEKTLCYIQPILLYDEIVSAHFVTMNKAESSLEYGAFSMPAILVLHDDGILDRLPSNNPPINKYCTNFTTNSINCAQMQKIIFYSDGLVENAIKGGDDLYLNFIEEDFIRAFSGDDMRAMIEERFAAQEDDMTFIFLSKLAFEKANTVTHVVSTSLVALGDANTWYEEALADMELDGEVIERAAYTFSELLLNAYEHGNLGIPGKEKHRLIESGDYWDVLAKKEDGCQKEISVKLYHVKYQQKHYLLTKIEDEGNGFDANILRDIFYRTNKYNGRGVYISKKFSNGIYYNESGNCVLYINKFTTKEGQICNLK